MNRLDLSKESNQLITPPEKTRLFVQDVIDFSSQYGKENSNSYTVANIRQKPHYFPKYGDFLESCVFRQYGEWWSRLDSNISFKVPNKALFISKDFMEVKFEHKIQIESVTIYETYHPGSIVALYAYDYFKSHWICLWSIFNSNQYKCNLDAINRQIPPKSSRKFEPYLIRQDVYSDTLRVELDHTKLEYYSELDAVEISGVSFDLSTLRSITRNIKQLSNCFEDLIHLESLSNHDNENVNITSKNNKSIEYRRQNTLEKRSPINSNNIITTCSNIVDLPTEILCFILNYLDLKSIFQLRSTCKTFYDVCTYDYLYHKIDLQPYWHIVNDDFIELLTDITDNITHLNLSWLKLEKEKPIENLFQISCKNLTILKLDCCKFINGHKLKLICENCPLITQLSLQSCININNSSDDKFNHEFKWIKLLKNLTSLDLYRTYCDQESLIEIITSCSKLKHLNLGSCIKIFNFDDIIQVIANNLKNIQSLDLWRAYSLTAKGIYQLANNCLDLEELDIGWCRSINPIDCLQILIKNCKNLKKLFLTSIKITDRELESICKNLTKLEQLDILGSNSVNVNTAKMVLDSCTNLKLFDISFCNHIDMITHKTWTQIYTNCSIKKSFQSDL